MKLWGRGLGRMCPFMSSLRVKESQRSPLQGALLPEELGLVLLLWQEEATASPIPPLHQGHVFLWGPHYVELQSRACDENDFKSLSVCLEDLKTDTNLPYIVKNCLRYTNNLKVFVYMLCCVSVVCVSVCSVCACCMCEFVRAHAPVCAWDKFEASVVLCHFHINF